MKPTKPQLWEQVKKKYRATTEGTPRGRWGRRKAALARLEYRDRGGEWKKTPGPGKAS
ncbi:MAG: hypothetical protein M3N18_07875 [Actinomycetota bacterium]|nr:hypothetical protein [Actinomycetota bacterium]